MPAKFRHGRAPFGPREGIADFAGRWAIGGLGWMRRGENGHALSFGVEKYPQNDDGIKNAEPSDDPEPAGAILCNAPGRHAEP